MIFQFFNYLKKYQIDYCIINGYEDIIKQKNTQSDIDILLRQKDFINIEQIIRKFSNIAHLKMVQVLHHDLWAKNIFLYNPLNSKYLNLDLYGELSRSDIVLFKEKEIFYSLQEYKNIPILSFEKEFCYYLIKKLDKNDLSLENFLHLKKLYEVDKLLIDEYLKKFFSSNYQIVSNIFQENNFHKIEQYREKLIRNFYSTKTFNIKRIFFNFIRTIKRVLHPTGISIAFLGPDGSGKSTIINAILEENMPFRRKDYFHLKPIKSKNSSTKEIVTNPHEYQLYLKSKSYLKLLYFVYQYNIGWVRNIINLQIRSSLIIFDRYFDDILVDYRRYRYGGNIAVAKLICFVIPKPEIYFILTTNADTIYKRKQEVTFVELKRQIVEYEKLVDNKRYFHINVNKIPKEISKEIIGIIMEKMNERY